MNYLLIDKSTSRVLAVEHVEQKLDKEKVVELFPDYDPNSMKIAWTDLKVIPEDFIILPSGRLLTKITKSNQQIESVNRRLLSRKASLGKVPLESIEAEDLVKSWEDLFYFNERLNQAVDVSAGMAYPRRLEASISRNYLMWLGEGKPEKDEREVKFLKMNQFLAEIDQNYQTLWEYSQKKFEALSKDKEAMPTSSSTKAEIKDFLDAKHIPYNKSDTKAELLARLDEAK